MGKEILVNVANRETRIAVLDDNQLVELRIEREEQVVGNIYKGRVENVLPGMDAAFVDIGLERNAFLYVADILPEYVDSDDDEADDDGERDGDGDGDAVVAAVAADDEPGAPTVAADGQRSRAGQRSRSRRGRREPAPAAQEEPGATESAAEDYSLYLSDPDRGSFPDADSGGGDGLTAEDEHSRAFFAEMSTEDGIDFGDVADVDFEPGGAGGMGDDSVAGGAEAAVSPQALRDAAFDSEIEPHAEELAREAQELLSSEDAVNGHGEPFAAAGPADGAAGEAQASPEADDADREQTTLDYDAAMTDAAAEAAQPEDAAVGADGAEDVPPPPSAAPARPASRSGGRRGGSGRQGSGERPIGQSKRPMRRSGGRGFSRRHASIADLVQTKQELLLQVVKGPRGTKGSRVSTRMSLPGRYLVLMPDANNLGVSRKIEESKERDRLKNIVERFRQPGYGIIVRTEAEGRSASDLYQDYSMLVETWQNVWTKAKTTPAPSLIHQDQSLIYTIMRDVFGSDIERLIIDSADDYARACEIIDRISPDLTDRIHLYDGEKPLFEAYHRVEQDIDRLLRRKVWLKSGGYLVIDQTEALTSIDVNTGKFVGSSGSGLSDTILQTNMEATGEIARQLRLRDLGGMIVLDFIDMDNQRDKKSVTDALFRALKDDRSRTKIASISPLGLIEMTRKRTKETVDVALTDTCPYCHGIGRVPSAETVSMQVEREIVKIATDVASEAIVVAAHPDVVAHLVGEQGQSIDALERQVRRAIYVRAESEFHIEKYEVEPGAPAKIEQHFPLPRRGQALECPVRKSLLSELPWASAFSESGYQVEIVNGGRAVGTSAKIRLLSVARSYAIGEVIGGVPSNGKPAQGQGQGQGQQRQSGQQTNAGAGERDQPRGGRRSGGEGRQPSR